MAIGPTKNNAFHAMKCRYFSRAYVIHADYGNGELCDCSVASLAFVAHSQMPKQAWHRSFAPHVRGAIPLLGGAACEA
jgi:hypothetical protein